MLGRGTGKRLGRGTILTLPAELTERHQWCTWKQTSETKIPLQPNGFPIRSNDPSTFVSFDVARAASDKIAYVIQADDGFTGIDLDNCFDDNGMLRDWASPIVARLEGIAFAEVSPSGKGIKFITRGKKSTGAKCVHRFGGEKQQIEVYDFNRFWTITGDVYAGNLEIGDGQPVVDWICDTYLTSKPEPVLPPVTETRYRSDKIERASKYLAEIDPAISGSGGHDTTFRAACKLVIGFGLSPDEAFSMLLSEYNHRCLPPWTEKELRHKVDSAAKQPGVRGELFAESLSTEIASGVDLSGLNIIEEVKTKPEKRPQLDESLLMPDGLLGEMVKFVRETARYDLPEVTLASCLAFSGMILGRRVRAVDDTRPNLFCLSIAESGTGKNHPRQTIKRIMHAAGIDIPREGAASATSVARLLARNPSAVIQIDEAGLAFRAMKNPRSPQAELGGLLSELFTSSNGFFSYRAYADSKNETPVDQPHLSINAITTEQQLYTGGFTHEDIEQGLFGRFLLFRPRDMDPEERFDLEVLPVPDSVVDRIKSWWDFTPWDRVAGANLQPDHPEPMVVPFSESAKFRYRQYAQAITSKMRGEDTFRKALWRRSKEKTSRLALVHACMKSGHREGIVIDKDSMDWAIAISNYSTRGMVYDMDYAMVESAYQANVQYFLAKIPPDGIEWWQLSRKLKKFRPKERDEILNDLIGSGTLRIDEVKTGGTPKRLIKLA